MLIKPAGPGALNFGSDGGARTATQNKVSFGERFSPKKGGHSVMRKLKKKGGQTMRIRQILAICSRKVRIWTLLTRSFWKKNEKLTKCCQKKRCHWMRNYQNLVVNYFKDGSLGESDTLRRASSALQTPNMPKGEF